MSARVARPAAPVAALPAAGSAWPGARGARALARASRACAARGHQNSGSTTRRCGLKAPPRTARRRSSSCRLPLTPRRPFRRCALLEHPRANNSALTRCASLRSLRPRLALSAALRSRTARPPLRSGLLRAASPGALEIAALSRGSGCFAHFVRGERVLDVGENALLRRARQLAHALENLTCFADRSGRARRFALDAEQVIDGHGERFA